MPISIMSPPGVTLTPQQVLAALIGDPDLDQIKTLAVVYVLENKDCFVCHSHVGASDLMAMGVVLSDHGLRKLRG